MFGHGFDRTKYTLHSTHYTKHITQYKVQGSRNSVVHEMCSLGDGDLRGVNEMGSKGDREFRRWGFHEMGEFRRWEVYAMGVHEMGSS